MKRRQRGQSALEYLVTYGWAILAIVIIAAVLWFTGVFNPDRFASSKQCGGFASFTCVDYQAVEGGTVTLVLANNVGRQVDGVNASIGLVVSSNPGVDDIDANEQVSLTIANLADSTAGQYTISVMYTDTLSGLQHTETGFVKVV